MGSTKEQLIEYMNALKRLEVEKLTLERTISELKYKCKSLGHRESLKSPEHNGFFGLILIGICMGGMALFYSGIASGIIWCIIKLFFIHSLSFKWLWIPPVVIAVIATIITPPSVKKGERDDDKKYKSAVAKDESRVNKELVALKNLNADIALLESALDNVNSSLSRLYSLGILYPNYQGNIVAITEIHKYLESVSVKVLKCAEMMQAHI